MRLKYLLRFAIGGDLRFLSHRDSIRLFERVLVRSGVPVKYSEGFNPRIRLWLPLPRSVGTYADDEVLVFEVTKEIDTEEGLARMREQSPLGVQLHSLRATESSASPRPVRAHYELVLGECSGRQVETGLPQDVDLVALGEGVERFLGSTSWPVERQSWGGQPSGARSVDLRPLVAGVQLDGRCLRLVLSVKQQGSAKPAEVLKALGLAVEHWVHRLRRTGMEWDPPLPA